MSSMMHCLFTNFRHRTPQGWCDKLVDVAEGSGPGFWFVLSPGPTTASSLYLAKQMKWPSLEEKAKIEHVEVCPSALKLTAEIARGVGEDGGGALVVDYGDNVIVSDSLQAIRNHELKVLQVPGSADLSAYVDFAAIKHAVEDAAGSSAFGPVCQWQFLGTFGDQFSTGRSPAECNWGARRGSATWLLEFSGRWSTTLARQG